MPFSIDHLRSIGTEAANVRQQHDSALQQLNDSEDYSDEYKRERKAELDSARTAKWQNLAAQRERAAESLRGAARHEPEMSVEAVQRQGNAWSRVRSILESGATVDDVLEDVVPEDVDTIDALHAYLPSHLFADATRRSTSSANREQVQRQAKAQAKEVLGRVDLIEAKAPGERGARAKARAEFAGVLLSVDTEIDGLGLDMVGQPLAGSRRLSEAYAQGEADRAQLAVSEAG